MKNGVAFLLNYTYSKDLDDVGSPDYNGANPGAGAKNWQTGLNYAKSYGVSPLDHTHRLTFYHDLQLPVGQGRYLLGNPGSLGAKVLDRVVGGWEYAGVFTYISGDPLFFTVSNQGAYGSSDLVYNLFGSFAGSGSPSSITPSNFKNSNQVFINPLANANNATVRRFDISQFVPVTAMQYGNLPPIYPGIRNPAIRTYDASIMKSFYFSAEHARYLQLRLEAENVFNMVVPGSYNTDASNPSTFGLITGPAQTGSDRGERLGQISLRLVF